MSVQTYFDGGYTNYEVNLSAVEKERKVITDKNGVATSEEIVIKKSRIGQTTCGEQYLIEKRTTIRTPRATVLKSCETQPNELNVSSEVEQSASCDQISESEAKCEVEPSEKAPTDKAGETVSESKQNVNCKASIDKVNRAVSRPSLNFSHILLKNLPQDEAQQTGLNCQDNLTSENAVNSSGVGTDPVKPQKTNLLNQGSSFSDHGYQTSKNHPSERLLRGNQISDIIITKNSGTQCNLPPPKKVSYHSADG
ncbi:hypothetical protein EB796_004418 [Bugula neritina]|uniref:Uncharacterized protein n=1 Tax=Bugula neritina TaxID=10212 RepID=A0A7J7KF37_BUGNE|nr:hypothetical protein EB796_004418 [Bugula neritina]